MEIQSEAVALSPHENHGNCIFLLFEETGNLVGASTLLGWFGARKNSSNSW